LIEPEDLLHAAVEFLFVDGYSEAALRRAVSTAYYGLFHTIAAAGAALFSGPPELRAQIARGYDHASIASACKQLEDALRQRAFDRDTPDARLVALAIAFRQLREARENADYVLTWDLSWDEAADFVGAAWDAYGRFAPIKTSPEAAAFLVAPLLRKRRG
jgi:hypothetical protein